MRRENLAAAAVAAKAGGDAGKWVGEVSLDDAMDRTIADGATGPTHMSRMAREMEKRRSKL